MVPVEAMASGRPVIAYGRGGATETVADGVSGVFFAEQTFEAISSAVKRLAGLDIDPARIVAHASHRPGAVLSKNAIPHRWPPRQKGELTR